MNFDLVRPCAECPFRTDRPGFLGGDRAAEIIDTLLRKQGTFACHKTTEDIEGEDGLCDRQATENSQHCAGALILLERTREPNQMMRIAERLGLYDFSRLDMDAAPVFETAQEFITHHQDEQDGSETTGDFHTCKSRVGIEDR